MKQWRNGKMNKQIRKVLKKRYEAEIADAKYKIKCYSEHELVIPEHPDITVKLTNYYRKLQKLKINWQ
jgi:tRNA A37 threonylcarbamoyladenosine dehydratase